MRPLPIVAAPPGLPGPGAEAVRKGCPERPPYPKLPPTGFRSPLNILSAIGRFRSGEIGKNGRQPTATRPLLAAPAVAPAPTGEVTAADRDPASTGGAEVLAPAGPGSSARAAPATYLRLRPPSSNGAYGKPRGYSF